MAGPQPGRDAGITGLVDIPGFGAKFEIRLYKWKSRVGGTPKPRRGRGSTDFFNDVRWIFSDGSIAGSGKVRLSGWPAPDKWRGERGTIRVQVDIGKYVTYPIEVTEMGFDLTEKMMNTPDVALAAQVTGQPTYTGWPGTQPAAGTPTKTDQEQYDGTSKSIDPGKLQSGAIRHIDIWGNLSDTDIAEQTKLLAVIAAAAAPCTTPHAFKLRSSTFARDALDGGTITETWGLTTTDEDQLNTSSNLSIDPTGLGSGSITAAFNSTPAAPSTIPYAGGSWVKWSEDVKEFNDSMVLHTVVWRELSQQSAIEYPGTPTTTDQKNLRDTAQITKVTTSETPPTTPSAPVGQIYAITSTRRDDGHWVHVFDYRNNTSQQDVEFEGTSDAVDPSALQGEQRVTSVNSSSTPPSTPSADAGLVLRQRISKRIGGTPEKWSHTFLFAQRTTEEDITFPGTVTSDEVSDIGDEATITRVTSSSTPPTTPSAPVGQLLAIESEQLTDAGKWKHKFTYGNTTQLQRIQFPTDTVETDPSALQDEDRQSATASSSTVPATPATRISGCVLRSVSSVRIAGTPEKWLHRWTFTRRTTEEDITFPGTVISDDQSDLEDERTITVVVASSTPSNPGTPSGFVWRKVDSEQLTDAGKWKHKYTYTRRSSEEDVTFPGTLTRDDQSDLEDERTITLVTASSTPTNPGTPSGLVYRRVDSEQLTDAGKWKHRFTYTRKTAQEEVEFPGTITADDPSNIADESSITLVQASSTPSAPGVPSGMQLVNTVSEQLTDAGKWKHRFEYKRLTERDKLVLPHTWVNTDVSDLKSEGEQARMDGESANPSTLNAGTGTLVKRGETTKQVTHPSFGNRQIFIGAYGAMTTQQEEEYRETIAESDWLNVYLRRTTTVTNDSTSTQAQAEAGVLAANKSDSTFTGSKVIRVTPSKIETTLINSGEDKKFHSQSNHVFRDSVRGVPARLIQSGPPYTQGPILSFSENPGNILASDHFAYVLIDFNAGALLAKEIYIWRGIGSFMYRRVYATSNPPDYQYLAVIGTTNDQAFLGFAQGQCMYKGPAQMFTKAIAGTLRLVVDFEFATDSHRFFNDGYLPDGTVFVTDGSIPGVTQSGLWRSNMLGMQIGVTFPAQSSFLGFTT